MATIGDLVVNLGLNQSGFNRGLTSSKGSLGGWAKGLSSVVMGPIGAMVGTVGAAIGGAFAVGNSISAANEQIRAQQKLEAVLRATGGAAGLTGQQIADYASDLQRVTNFGDEATIASAAVLATFKEVKGGAFKEALGLAQDMATVLDGDVKGSVLQIGKALNDPIRGMTALTRSGVSFTEQQKQQVKQLQAMGDVAGAQKIILGELRSEFGGAAAAVADPFTQARNIMGDVAELLGFVLRPALSEVLSVFTQSSGELTNNSQSFKDLGESIAGVVRDGIGPMVQGMSSAFTWIVGAVDTIAFSFRNMGLLSQLAIVELQQTLIDLFPNSVPAIEKMVVGFVASWAAIKAGANSAFEWIKGGFTELGNIAMAFGEGLRAAIDAALSGGSPLKAFTEAFTAELAKQKDVVIRENPAEAMRRAFDEAARQKIGQFAADGGLPASLKKQREQILAQMAESEKARTKLAVTPEFSTGGADGESNGQKFEVKANAGLQRGSREAFSQILQAQLRSQNPNAKLETIAEQQLEATQKVEAAIKGQVMTTIQEVVE